MTAPYKRGKHFRHVHLSKVSTVEEDHSKSSDDETRISREPDINDIGGVVEGEPSNAKEPNIISTVSIVSAQKRKGSFGGDINHEKDVN